MALESTLKELEAKVGQLVAAHATARDRVAELEARVAELEAEAAAADEAQAELEALRGRQTELADRLDKVLGLVDKALTADEKADS